MPVGGLAAGDLDAGVLGSGLEARAPDLDSTPENPRPETKKQIRPTWTKTTFICPETCVH